VTPGFAAVLALEANEACKAKGLKDSELEACVGSLNFEQLMK
jgi:hypothetical protein